MHENVLAVSSGLGSSHSAQGVSATFSDTQIRMAVSQLPVLQRIKEQYEATATGGDIPPPPGVNLSYYLTE